MDTTNELVLKVWRTVYVHPIGDWFRKLLYLKSEYGIESDGYLQNMAIEMPFDHYRGQLNTLKQPKEVKLARATVGDLGLGSGATTEQIWERIKTLGGELCPPELGPALRIQYLNQPENEYLYIAMDQLRGMGWEQTFYLGHHTTSCMDSTKRLVLYTQFNPPHMNLWLATTEFVFVLRG